MKKIVLLLAACVSAFSQSQIYGDRVWNAGKLDAANASETRLKTGTTANLPSTCNPGDQYFETDAVAGKNLMGCTSANTWVQLAGGGAAGVNLQTGTYTMTNSDSGKLVVMNCSSACTVSLPTSPTSGFYAGIESIGTVVPTVSLSSKTFNGGSSAPVLNSYRTFLVWSDGNNYFGEAPLIAGPNVSFTPATSGFTISATAGGGGVQTGTFANMPTTCSVGQLYFATDRPLGQDLYICTSANTWNLGMTPTGLGASGGLTMNTSGNLDINTAVVPTLGNPNTFTAQLSAQNGISLKTANTQPGCSSSTQGLIWYLANGSGSTPDTGMQACQYNGSSYAWATVGSGGGGAIQLISKVVLSTAQPSVTFSSIPQNYTNLIIEMTFSGDSSTAGDVAMLFNGDTGTNYNFTNIYPSGSTTSATTLSGANHIQVNYHAVANGTASYSRIHIPLYSGTTFQKVAEINYNQEGTAGLHVNGYWNNTAAITSITLSQPAGNFVVGSTFSLYGEQ
jgi:hypothetical protein